jgi:hypothetical protein
LWFYWSFTTTVRKVGKKNQSSSYNDKFNESKVERTFPEDNGLPKTKQEKMPVFTISIA